MQRGKVNHWANTAGDTATDQLVWSTAVGES